LFLNEKKNFGSPILALYYELAKLGKVSQDACHPGLWIILWDLLKNWLAKSVASNVNDFNVEVHLFPLLAGLGQRSSVLCMLVLPNSQSTSFNWFSKVDNKRKELTVL